MSVAHNGSAGRAPPGLERPVAENPSPWGRPSRISTFVHSLRMPIDSVESVSIKNRG